MARPLEVHSARERERIRRIVGGDAEAFHSLVREYHALAYSVAFKVLHNGQDAEEVVQDAFIKIHRALDGFRGQGSLKAWIVRIVLRLSLNRRRDRSRSSWYRLGLHFRDGDGETEPVLDAAALDAAAHDARDPETLCLSREARQLLLGLVDELPESLREVLVLNSFEELSYQEIARILRIPLGTVSSRLSTARAKLRKKLEQHDLLV